MDLNAAAGLTPRVVRRLKVTAPSTLVQLASGAAHRVFPNNAAHVASKHVLAALAADSGCSVVVLVVVVVQPLV